MRGAPTHLSTSTVSFMTFFLYKTQYDFCRWAKQDMLIGNIFGGGRTEQPHLSLPGQLQTEEATRRWIPEEVSGQEYGHLYLRLIHFLRERCGEGLCSRPMGTEKRLESRHQNGDSISKWVTGKKYSKQVKVVSLLLFLISQKCSINENSQFLPFLLLNICRSI